MEVRTEVTDVAGWTVVAIHGELDIASAPAFRERLIDIVNDRGVNLVLDLDGIDFLDSTGLGVIVGALKRVRTQDGDLRIVCSQPRIRRLFEITGLDRAMPLLDSLDAAVARG